MPDELSVRQWQEQFRAGAFNLQDRYTQCRAGWYDWFCQDHALAGRLKKIGRVVMGITDPFILDNYYVWFKNNCPLNGPLYDDVRFEPLSGNRDGKYFVISLDSPHERMKWALVTERYGFDAPEFDCRNVRDMIKYINVIGPELERDVQPPFIAEKCAVITYAKLRGDPAGIQVYRDGDVGNGRVEKKSGSISMTPVAASTSLKIITSHVLTSSFASKALRKNGTSSKS